MSSIYEELFGSFRRKKKLANLLIANINIKEM